MSYSSSFECLRTRVTLVLLLSALFTFAGCGGEEAASAPELTTATPSLEEATPPEAEPQDELAEEPAGEPTGELAEVAEDSPAEVPLLDPPGYGSAPSVCEAHPENAPAEPVSRRAISRGEVDFPLVAAVNATCEHDPAELAEAFNEGGLRRHRQRDYVQSAHYFASALVLDPSQLSARFNFACALARQEDLHGAVLQLRELEEGGRDGIEYAARAHRDRDFGAYHQAPLLAALRRDAPSVVQATKGRDAQLFSEVDPSTHNDALFGVTGERVWEPGSLSSEDFSDFVLSMEPDRRRYRFFNERPSDAVQGVLEAMGLRPLLRNAGWTPAEEQNYLVALVSSRDEDRHTLYLAKVMDDGLLQPIDSRDLPASTCGEGAEAVRTFVEAEDHRAFGYITGCVGAAPATFERCLYYFSPTDGVARRCGQGEEPPAEEAPTDQAGTAEP